MTTEHAQAFTQRSLLWAGFVLIMLGGCGGDETRQEAETSDPRAALLEACETQQGIGWLKREHGDAYCECWADTAEEVLGEANYDRLVQAARAELRAADVAERERIARENTDLYTSVSNAARSCGSAN